MEQIRRKERNEAHLYMSVQVLLEDSFDGHQGNDLYDPDRALYRVFRVRKQTTLQELLEHLADSLVSNMFLWVCSSFQIGIIFSSWAFPEYVIH